MKNQKIKTIFSLFFIAYFSLFTLSVVLATDYTSSSFTSRDPVTDIYGGNSTSSNFENIIAGGQIAIGESTSSNFILRAGFLYFGTSSVESDDGEGFGGDGAAGGGGVWVGSAQQGGYNLKGNFHQISFEGITYQKAPIIIVSGDKIITTQFADSNGIFNIFLGELSPGTYKFGLFTIQPNNTASAVKFYDVYILNNSSIKIEGINFTRPGIISSVSALVYPPPVIFKDGFVGDIYSTSEPSKIIHQSTPIALRIVKVFASKLSGKKYIENPYSWPIEKYLWIILLI